MKEDDLMENKLTVVILTKNEEDNIINAIENAKLVSDDVLIIDSGSTDRTVVLAEAAGARIAYREWDDDFAAQRNFAISQTDAEWLLYLDADEEMNEDLVSAIRKILSGPSNPAMYRFIRRTSAFGKNFRYGVLSPDSVVRLFPRIGVRWVNKVHEHPESENLKTVTLPGYLRHYTYKNYAQYVGKMNLYSSIWADNNRHKKVFFLKDIVLKPAFAFFKMYVLQGGFLEGWLGFALSASYADYTMNKYAKLKMLKEEEISAIRG